MKKPTREKLNSFNKWIADAPDMEIDKNDIDAIIENDEMTTGELQAIRSHLDFDQKEMAKILGAKLSTYQKWERNPEAKHPTKVPLVAAELLRIFYTYPHLMAARLKKPKRIK